MLGLADREILAAHKFGVAAANRHQRVLGQCAPARRVDHRSRDLRRHQYRQLMSQPATKLCVVCGRTMRWRKRWERSWDEVRHCSAMCRRRGVRPVDRELEAAIVRLLSARSQGSTICPSDAAREIGGADWQTLMEPARAAARRLQARGDAVINQGGRPVDPSTAKGPIRIGRS